MNISKSMPYPLFALVLASLLQFVFIEPLQAEPDDPKLANKRCLMCHGKEGFSRDDKDLSVMADVFGDSVHGSQDCVGCHTDITKVPHRKGVQRGVGCVQCHMDEWGEEQESGAAQENGTLQNVVEHIESYMDSMHARCTPGRASTTSRVPTRPATTATDRTTSSPSCARSETRTTSI
jgi:cytochrome c